MQLVERLIKIIERTNSVRANEMLVSKTAVNVDTTDAPTNADVQLPPADPIEKIVERCDNVRANEMVVSKTGVDEDMTDARTDADFRLPADPIKKIIECSNIVRAAEMLTSKTGVDADMDDARSNAGVQISAGPIDEVALPIDRFIDVPFPLERADSVLFFAEKNDLVPLPTIEKADSVPSPVPVKSTDSITLPVKRTNASGVDVSIRCGKTNPVFPKAVLSEREDATFLNRSLSPAVGRFRDSTKELTPDARNLSKSLNCSTSIAKTLVDRAPDILAKACLNGQKLISSYKATQYTDRSIFSRFSTGPITNAMRDHSDEAEKSSGILSVNALKDSDSAIKTKSSDFGAIVSSNICSKIINPRLYSEDIFAVSDYVSAAANDKKLVTTKVAEPDDTPPRCQKVIAHVIDIAKSDPSVVIFEESKVNRDKVKTAVNIASLSNCFQKFRNTFTSMQFDKSVVSERKRGTDNTLGEGDDDHISALFDGYSLDSSAGKGSLATLRESRISPNYSDVKSKTVYAQSRSVGMLPTAIASVTSSSVDNSFAFSSIRESTVHQGSSSPTSVSTSSSSKTLSVSFPTPTHEGRSTNSDKSASMTNNSNAAFSHANNYQNPLMLDSLPKRAPRNVFQTLSAPPKPPDQLLTAYTSHISTVLSAPPVRPSFPQLAGSSLLLPPPPPPLPPSQPLLQTLPAPPLPLAPPMRPSVEFNSAFTTTPNPSVIRNAIVRWPNV